MIRIGTSGWSYRDWLGNFYPKEIDQADYLSFYAKHFDTVEVDSTFYAIPRKSTVENWYKSVPADFKFAAKFPQKITHESDLTGVQDTLKKFLETMSILREKLGPLLLQFPYSFKPEMAGNLEKFIEILPRDFDFVIEIRNRKWLNDGFYEMLRKKSIALALLDHPWMPKVEIATSHIAYIRFLGDRKKIPEDFTREQVDRQKDLEGWQRVILALEEKVDDFYGYFNNHYSGHSPTTAERFIKMIGEKG